MFSWLKNKKKNKEQDKQAQQEPQPQELESEESIEDSAPPVAAEEALPVEVAVPAVEPELETPAPIVEEEVVAVEQPIEPGPEPESGKGWLSRMTDGLSKSSSKITQGLTDLVTKKKLDQETLDNLEDLLIEADLGPQTAMKIIEEFSKDRFGKDISEEEVQEALANAMEAILEPVAKPLPIAKPDGAPFVILVCGVNGAGKTTTIGKYAHALRAQGHSVMMAAGDTFRAAAVEQLEEWAKRSGAIFVSKDIGADSAAVAYEAYEQAKAQNVDVLLLDTAGRLHNKSNLMAELEKIIRVLKKQDETVPHATLLVLDATTGQNAFAQLEAFKEMVNITGLIVTKLDGSAKGGVLVGLADQFGVPVHAIGVGEGIEDMQSFNARDYAKSLVGLA